MEQKIIFEEKKGKISPNLLKNYYFLDTQEAQQSPGKINTKKITPSHTKVKLLKIKDKEKILKADRGKRVTHYIHDSMITSNQKN